MGEKTGVIIKKVNGLQENPEVVYTRMGHGIPSPGTRPDIA